MPECIINFGDFDWWGILVATLASYAFGALWYSPFLFGNTWVKLNRLKEEDMKKSAGTAMLVTFITTFFTVMVVEIFIVGLQTNFIGQSIMVGILIGLFVLAGNMLSENLYSNRPLKLWLVSAGYRFFMVMIIAIVLGLWR